MEKSTHRCEVVRIENIENHPNADRLDVIQVWGYTVITQKGLWKPGDLAVYIPPDSIVPDTEQFSFLEGKLRIKAKKLRGIYSFGMLTTVPDGATEGEDVAERMGITHYEPKPVHEKLNSGLKTRKHTASPPQGEYPKYDVDSIARYKSLLDGCNVVITEKIHGSNICVLYRDGEFHVRSRTVWHKEDESVVYWKALHNSPILKEFLVENEGVAVYGEVTPMFPGFLYGHAPGNPSIYVFDILQKGQWMNALEAKEFAPQLNWVPTLASDVLFSFDQILEMSNGKTLTNDTHIREGVVVKPVYEKWHPKVGRLQLKMVGGEFLEKSR